MRPSQCSALNDVVIGSFPQNHSLGHQHGTMHGKAGNVTTEQAAYDGSPEVKASFHHPTGSHSCFGCYSGPERWYASCRGPPQRHCMAYGMPLPGMLHKQFHYCHYSPDTPHLGIRLRALHWLAAPLPNPCLAEYLTSGVTCNQGNCLHEVSLTVSACHVEVQMAASGRGLADLCSP